MSDQQQPQQHPHHHHHHHHRRPLPIGITKLRKRPFSESAQKLMEQRNVPESVFVAFSCDVVRESIGTPSSTDTPATPAVEHAIHNLRLRDSPLALSDQILVELTYVMLESSVIHDLITNAFEYKSHPELQIRSFTVPMSRIHECVVGIIAEYNKSHRELPITVTGARLDTKIDFSAIISGNPRRKVLACALGEVPFGADKLGERLWIEEDVVPFLARPTRAAIRELSAEERALDMCKTLASQYIKEEFFLDVFKIPRQGQNVQPFFLTTIDALNPKWWRFRREQVLRKREARALREAQISRAKRLAKKAMKTENEASDETRKQQQQQQQEEEIVPALQTQDLTKLPAGEMSYEDEIDQIFVDFALSHFPQEEFEWMLQQAQRFKQLKGSIVFINSTAQGGGVALMRHAMIRVLHLLEVDCKWFVLRARNDDDQVFQITKKKFHNMLQGVAPRHLVLNDDDKQVYDEWIDSNRDVLSEDLRSAKVIVIDDYQPSGLIPFIKRANSTAKIIFRSHIHVVSELVEAQDSPQRITWRFLWRDNKIKDCDIFVSHPIPDFVPNMVPKEKVVMMAASTYPIDGLNKHLTQNQLNYYLNLLNCVLIRDEQKPLDISRPYICQIARFDPSKGIQDVLQSYRYLRKICRKKNLPEHKVPQLIIAGVGAIDDPEGLPVLEETKQTLTLDMFSEIKDDIKLARLPHNDQILNAVLTGSRICLQLSHKEGLEVKVSEALFHGKPMVLYRAGGMPLQVIDGVNAFVVPVGKTQQVAQHLFNLLSDEQLYERMSRAAREKVSSEFFTVNNVTCWLFMCNELIEKGEMKPNGRHIMDLMYEAGKPRPAMARHLEASHDAAAAEAQ